ncbi:unnamed protein product [Vitrella brassicaformis CCMP3155]|uniref:CS domain-containing protein n=2 Tax=Vitrella brassicaformis TaxID=1169539 RepID=A0A0G4EK09_VITBC|nr:unnamed protein product [Vitrella brassicaformis CCMP3155]|eukprot:CEL97084.1 unnamed protein product [Vitrella brassicaformis CCMP3155]
MGLSATDDRGSGAADTDQASDVPPYRASITLLFDGSNFMCQQYLSLLWARDYGVSALKLVDISSLTQEESRRLESELVNRGFNQLTIGNCRCRVHAILPDGRLLQDVQNDPQTLLFEYNYLRSAISSRTGPQQRLLDSAVQIEVARRRATRKGDWWIDQEVAKTAAKQLEKDGFVVVERFLEAFQCESVLKEVEGLVREDTGLGKELRRDGVKVPLLEKNVTFEEYNSQTVDGLSRALGTTSGVVDQVDGLMRAVAPHLSAVAANPSQMRRIGDAVLFCRDQDGASALSEPSQRDPPSALQEGAKRFYAALFVNTDWSPSVGGGLRLSAPSESSPSPVPVLEATPLGGRLILFDAQRYMPELPACFATSYEVQFEYQLTPVTASDQPPSPPIPTEPFPLPDDTERQLAATISRLEAQSGATNSNGPPQLLSASAMEAASFSRPSAWHRERERDGRFSLRRLAWGMDEWRQNELGGRGGRDGCGYGLTALAAVRDSTNLVESVGREYVDPSEYDQAIEALSDEELMRLIENGHFGAIPGLKEEMDKLSGSEEWKALEPEGPAPDTETPEEIQKRLDALLQQEQEQAHARQESDERLMRQRGLDVAKAAALDPNYLADLADVDPIDFDDGEDEGEGEGDGENATPEERLERKDRVRETERRRAKKFLQKLYEDMNLKAGDVHEEPFTLPDGSTDVYSWRETPEELEVWVPTPDGLGKRGVVFGSTPSSISIGFRSPADTHVATVLDGELEGRIMSDETYWTIDTDDRSQRQMLHVTCPKRRNKESQSMWGRIFRSTQEQEAT